MLGWQSVSRRTQHRCWRKYFWVFATSQMTKYKTTKKTYKVRDGFWRQDITQLWNMQRVMQSHHVVCQWHFYMHTISQTHTFYYRYHTQFIPFIRTLCWRARYPNLSTVQPVVVFFFFSSSELRWQAEFHCLILYLQPQNFWRSEIQSDETLPSKGTRLSLRLCKSLTLVSGAKNGLGHGLTFTDKQSPPPRRAG